MNGDSKRPGSRRLEKKFTLFSVISRYPSIGAPELVAAARALGVQISVETAYRTLRAYRENSGRLEDTEGRGVRIVSDILRRLPEGEHLSCQKIQEKTVALGTPVHQSSIYRVVSRLVSVGLVSAVSSSGEKYYEWRRDADTHGHLTCIKCGKTAEFHIDHVETVGRQISRHLGYDFERIELTLKSLCRSCQSPDGERSHKDD